VCTLPIVWLYSVYGESTMKKRNVITGSLMAVGLIALAAVGAADARPSGHCGAGHLGADAALGPHGHMGRLMRKLDLTQEQRDKVFGILHAQMPAAREEARELRAGREALNQAAMSGSYDPEQVRRLADAQAKTLSDLLVMQTETFSKVYEVFTPEQQAKAAELKDQWKEKRRGHRKGE
jgi:Spy/CpxP family protein refolding chaperone